GIILVGQVGSRLLDAGSSAGLRIRAEAFADRAYEVDGSLRDRRRPDALRDDPAAAAEQAVRIVVDRSVRAIDGARAALVADTLCVHGDAPGAALRAAAVRAALEAAGVVVSSDEAEPAPRRPD